MNTQPLPRLTIAYIQQAVASAYGIDARLLTSPRRSRRIARPRQVAMWLSVNLLPNHSYPMIGRHFGDRDHTTIMHGVKRIDALADSDPSFFDFLIDIRSRILAATERSTGNSVSIESQARELARVFTKTAFALAEAERAFRDISASVRPDQNGEKQ